MGVVCGERQAVAASPDSSTAIPSWSDVSSSPATSWLAIAAVPSDETSSSIIIHPSQPLAEEEGRGRERKIFFFFHSKTTYGIYLECLILELRNNKKH